MKPEPLDLAESQTTPRAWGFLRKSSSLLVALALVVVGCAPPPDQFDQGSVQELSRADTLLFSDQLGSVLVETDGRGAPKAHFSAYPYGVTRSDSSSETRKYAGAERDPALELDHMGARFYAPDLGVWTAPDPILLTRPEALVTGEFGTANAYAYANLNPTIAVDEDGNFWHIVAGAGIGALMGGGMEAARQYYEHGKVDDWGRVRGAALGGAVSGAMTAAMPVVGFLGARGSSGAASALGGLADRAIQSGGKDLGTVQDVLVDTALGAVTGGGGRGASKPTPKPKPLVDPTTIKATPVAHPVNVASPKATTHILKGDKTGGNHAYPGGKNKTSFPESWNDGKIMHEISDVATDPASRRAAGDGGRTIVYGTRDGVDIQVVIEKGGGDIVTGHPTNLPRNPK